MTNTMVINEATDKVVEYMYKEETASFIEYLYDEEMSYNCFVKKLKEHILYSVIVLKYRGNDRFINVCLQLVWEEYRERLGLDEAKEELEKGNEIIGYTHDSEVGVTPIWLKPTKEEAEFLKTVVGEEEVRGFCDECDREGKFIGTEGDFWVCPACLGLEEPEEGF